MNFSSSSVNITTNQFIDNINFITDIIGYYTITTVSAVGLILNLFMSIVLLNKDLKHNFYKYLWVKALIDVLVCIIGIGYLKSICLKCPSTNVNTFQILAYQWYMNKITMRTIFMSSSIHEIYLIVQRYLIIKGNKIFSNIKLKFYVPLIFLVPFILTSPFFFAIEIKPKGNDDDLYFWTQTRFGRTLFFKMYSLIITLPECLLSVIILITMNIITIKAYKDRMNIKKKFNNRRLATKTKIENRFTRIMIVLTVIFSFSKTSENVMAVIIRYSAFFGIKFGVEVVAIINCVHQFTLLFLFSVHSFDVFIYVPMDQNLKKVVKKTFLRNIILTSIEKSTTTR